MARTRNTKRISPPQEEESNPTKERKVNHYQTSRRTHPSTTFPTDICIVTLAGESYSNDLINCCNNLNKLNEHHCSESTCHSWLPEIDWEHVGIETELFSNEIRFNSSESDVSHRGRFSCICDERAGKEYEEMAMNILDKVISNVKSYELNTKVIQCEKDYERITSITIEYSMCGSKCYYKSHTDYEYEFLALLLGPDEYLAFGQIGCHAFYALPGLEYSNSDGSSPNICSEPIEIDASDEESELYFPNIIPLSKVLEKSKEFLRNVLDNRYH